MGRVASRNKIRTKSLKLITIFTVSSTIREGCYYDEESLCIIW
ncbi:hypothetical protein Bmyc01_49340 [Bacillus mycoides]|nr:hypothetical protein Bmyc01_49340 [Bacillus mycoides]